MQNSLDKPSTITQESPENDRATRRSFLGTAMRVGAMALLAGGCKGAPEEEVQGDGAKRWGERGDMTFLEFYKDRYDRSWKEAEHLQLQHEMLTEKLAEGNPSTALREEIGKFNQVVESVYNTDVFPWFGGDRPKDMPEELEFKPVPKIELIPLPD